MIIKKRNYTLVKYYMPRSHVYSVTIGTELGQFTGETECREVDWDDESKYTGYTLAEIKAIKKYYQAKRKSLKEQRKALVGFWKNMSTTRSYTPDAYWVKQIRKQVEKLNAQIDYWDCNIAQQQAIYIKRIQLLDEMAERRNKHDKI